MAKKKDSIFKKIWQGVLDRVECLEAVDFVAVAMIGGCTYLKATGHNGTVSAVLIAISAYYFGHKRSLF